MTKTAKKARANPKMAEARSFSPKGGETKHDLIVRMLRTEGGATSAELEKATGWQPHSVRGLIGTLKKRGERIDSLKEKGSPVRYHMPADQVGDVI